MENTMDGFRVTIVPTVTDQDGREIRREDDRTANAALQDLVQRGTGSS